MIFDLLLKTKNKNVGVDYIYDDARIRDLDYLKVEWVSPVFSSVFSISAKFFFNSQELIIF